MDQDRFAALVAAYGATPSRWPEEERDAAQAFARAHPPAAGLLAEADALDDWLFAYRVAGPSAALRATLIAAAGRRRRILQRVRLWWSGLAMAAAAGGGLLAGSAATAALDTSGAIAQIYANDMTVDDAASVEDAVK